MTLLLVVCGILESQNSIYERKWFDSIKLPKLILYSLLNLCIGIKGPCFISIGDAGQLSLFFEKNPELDKSLMLVDGLSFDAYNKGI